MAPWAVVAAAYAAGAAVAWDRSGSLFVDTGRELEVPRRLLEGGVLYRDVRYYWGPLAPSLNAALYGAFGVSLETLQWAGLATAALGTAGVFSLARPFVGRWPAALVASAFVFLCAFAQLLAVPIFNFALPFNFSATYGIVAAIWSVHLLLEHARGAGARVLFGSTLLLAAAFLCKAEVAFAAAAAHAAFAASAPRDLRRVHAAAWGTAAAIVAATYGAFFALCGPALWRDNLAALGNPASQFYVERTMGLAGWRTLVGYVALSALLLGGLWATSLALARLTARRAGTPAVLAAAALAAALAATGGTVVPLELALRGLPLLLLGALAVELWKRRRRPEGSPSGSTEDRSTEDLVLATFALACLARMPLTTGAHHYGFYLVPAALVWLAVLFFGYGPRAAGHPAGARVFAAAGTGLLAALVVAALRISLPALTAPYAVVDGPRGRLRVPVDVPEPALVEFLSRELPRVRSAVAVPQGVGVLFVAGLPSGSDGMTSYLPMELPDDAADVRLVERWASSPPELILYWKQDMREDFGRAGFGIDYAVRAGRWIAEHYDALTDPSQPIVLLVPRR